MGKKKFLRNYIGQQLFMLCDDDMEHAAEQQKLPYDMMEEIFESLDANHAIPKETVTKYGKLLKRMPPAYAKKLTCILNAWTKRSPYRLLFCFRSGPPVCTKSIRLPFVT